ncbi:MAG TPA: phosphate ABC transporter, permease protein PstA, partial [Candidatus Cloacimonadota bacterium]|nr:phosphate ABC transporter, permease protein PstA [Candidatus Cloacimonadota bacterium]
MRRKIFNLMGQALLGLMMLLSAAFLILFMVRIFSLGAKVVSFDFLFSAPRNSMREGGIFPALLGSFWLTVISTGIAL